MKHLEEVGKMQETMAELALMGEHATEMVVLTDAEGRIEWVNEPFVRTCGYTLEELRGTKPDGLMKGPESDPAALETLNHAIHSAHDCDCRIINYKKDGMHYPVYLSLGPVFSNGRLEGFLAVEEDLSVEEEQPATATGAR